jgi:predicted amidohydrolase
MNNFKAASIQLNSNDNYEASTEAAINYIGLAAKAGAKLIATPENTCHMGDMAKFLAYQYYSQDDHPSLKQFKLLAAELKIYLLIGSLVVKQDDKLANRSLLIGTDGEIIAYYDKIHLFDAKLTTGERYAESRSFKAGNKLVIADTDFGKIGMSICYDLRFPYLYRKLALAGAKLITVPSAFTYTTGSAHWHILLRARAIENGCYIIAPNQCGMHPGGRKTYGHSMIINPWGEIIAQMEGEPGFIIAEINDDYLENIRSNMPVLKHDKSNDL